MTTGKLPISLIMITFNEADNLKKCLPYLNFVQEIIIVDAESQDETVSIAKTYTNHVFVEPFKGFGLQKQSALNKASQAWVLSLDADEIPSLELIRCLQAQFQAGIPDTVSGFLIPFQNYFCGQHIRFGDFRHKPKLRLVRRTHARFSEDPVHETCLLSHGQIARLNAPLYHYSYPNLDAVLLKMRRYAKAGAQKRLQQGKTSRFRQALTHGLFTFIRGYFLKVGFLDGKWGFIVAWSRANECFYRHLLCWEGTKTGNSALSGVNKT